MVKVHVWMPNGNNVGHTALTVKNVYISFWPDGEAGKKDLKSSEVNQECLFKIYTKTSQMKAIDLQLQ